MSRVIYQRCLDSSQKCGSCKLIPNIASLLERSWTYGESERRAPGVDGPIRGSARQLRPDEVDQLVARYTAAQSIRLVADEFGLYRTTVREHLKRRGVEVRQVRSMTDPEIAEAVRLYEAGHSSVIVGEKLGFSHHTILKALRTANVAIRRPIGRQS